MIRCKIRMIAKKVIGSVEADAAFKAIIFYFRRKKEWDVLLLLL